MPRAPRAEAGTVWRLILDPPADGAWNLAVDEGMLERYASAAAPAGPTLRLYSWRPAALSLGKSQRAEAAHDPAVLRAEGIDLVRRPTGGTAVLHDRERTYAVIGRLGASPFGSGVRETYAQVAAALVQGLLRLGVPGLATAEPAGRARVRPEPACFGSLSAHEISAAGLKLVGSAQLRRRGAFLQHGSLPIEADAALLGRAVGAASAPAGCTDLRRALGRPVEPAEVERAIVEGFTAALGARFVRGGLSETEALAATRLRSRKYLSAAWTLHGRPADSPVEPG
jgi:lipoate-protein ligase A